LGVVLVLTLAASTFSNHFPSSYHFGVDKTIPVKDTIVESVSQISIWFTQVPQSNSVSIRLVDAGDSLVAGVEFEADSVDQTAFIAHLDNTLLAGSYKVFWRGIGQDGHVVTGDYDFTVSVE
jgi:methionine-rich copper-binding protein CopC|tara:strand:+ start:888 stop:1253 length:366 start_codon:yes stop_codon:yes gene_type:complete